MGCGNSKPGQVRPVAQLPLNNESPEAHKPQVKVQVQENQYQPQQDNSSSPQENIKIKVSEVKTSDEIFEDADFPAHLQSLTNDVNNENYETFKDAVWKRPPEIMNCTYDEIKVFDAIDVNDIAQGILGNCYFLASLSGLAEEPHRIKAIMQTQTANKNGKYSVKFFVRGIPTIITVDDRFPCYNYSPHAPLFSKPTGKELWAVIMEKAWAKVFKNYINIEAGTVEKALENLTGAPSFGVDVADETDDNIWNKLKNADQKKFIIGASSKDDVKESTGIVSGHAYTVVSVHEVQGHRLLRLRNPWGSYEWKGDFSDSSPLWTDSLKKAVQYENSDNGMFYMNLKDFRRHYDHFAVHHYFDNWKYSFVEQKSGPQDANYYKFSVTKPCEAYFRIHQKDERSLSENEKKTYKYSPASFMIVKVEKDGSYKLVLDSSVEIDNNLDHGARSVFMTKDGKVELKEAGDYIIRAKVQWRHGHEDTCTISAYSPVAISLQKISPIKDFQIKYCTLLGLQNQEENELSETSVNVSGTYQNYVYIMVKNRDENEFNVEIEFTKLENVRLIKSDKQSENKVAMKIPGGSNQIVLLKMIDRSQGSSYGWSWSWES